MRADIGVHPLCECLIENGGVRGGGVAAPRRYLCRAYFRLITSEAATVIKKVTIEIMVSIVFCKGIVKWGCRVVLPFPSRAGFRKP